MDEDYDQFSQIIGERDQFQEEVWLLRKKVAEQDLLLAQLLEDNRHFRLMCEKLESKVTDQDAEILAWRAVLAIWHPEAANEETPERATVIANRLSIWANEEIQYAAQMRRAVVAANFTMKRDVHDRPVLWCECCGRGDGFHWHDCRKAK